MVVRDVEVVGNAVIKREFYDLPHCFSYMADDACLVEAVAFAGNSDVERTYILERAHL